MKKVLLLLAFIGTMGAANAQKINGMGLSDIDSDHIEITITKRFLSSKVNVALDAGQRTKFINFAPRKNYFVVEGGDRKYNKVEFLSTADALNYFSELGYHPDITNGYAIFGPASSGLLQVLWRPFTFARGERIILTKKMMM